MFYVSWIPKLIFLTGFFNIAWKRKNAFVTSESTSWHYVDEKLYLLDNKNQK